MIAQEQLAQTGKPLTSIAGTHDRMNNDTLAAVVAAARLMLVSADTEPEATAACWTVAGRLRTPDAERVRRVARFRSRWAMMGRLS